MRVVRITDAGREPSDNPIFRGAVDYQTAVGENESRDLRLSEVHFKDGAVNKWHRHSCDQILLVTYGEGIVADETAERTIEAGDVAFIPANTRHWHGAKPGKDMTHWAILGNGKTTIDE
ncbi:MAG TPA: cupin domain-containing protein [Candidatus Limnocylindrales bacterium]|nr:cupin domain-containing protein [Candidatus Limnocylindrales bacterium]